jgi:hypothetical protein
VEEKKKRKKGRKEEEGASKGNDLGTHEPQQGGARHQRDNTQELGAPFLFFSPFKFSLLFVCAWSTE